MRKTARSSIPLYHQIAQVLRLRVESGAWGAGGSAPTEQSLCAEFGASRTTVRLALSQLKQAGLLESRAGVGTRHVDNTVKRKIARSGGDPLHASLDARMKVVAAGQVAAPPAVAAFFSMQPGETVWHFVRLYTLGSTPLSVVDSYMPAHLGEAFDKTDLQQPMHQLLWDRFGLQLDRSVHAVRVGCADVAIASMLGIALADPVLRIQSSVYLADGTPIRWTENSFREDQYEYMAEMNWPAVEHGKAAPSRPGKINFTRNEYAFR